jgi:hypothetical protein
MEARRRTRQVPTLPYARALVVSVVSLRLETNAAETFGFTVLASAVATALLMFVGPPRRGVGRSANLAGPVDKERPFGEPRSSEEPRDLELRRAREHGRGRHATHGSIRLGAVARLPSASPRLTRKV